MKKRVFFLTRLREGVDPADYERFLRETDYPLTRKLLPVSYYQATRLEGRAVSKGEVPFEYIEVLDVDDYEAYTDTFESPSPEVADLIQRVFSYVDDKTALDLYGEIVE
jgi:hypothetical protein